MGASYTCSITMAEPIDEPTGLPLALIEHWGLGCEGKPSDLADGTRQHDLTHARLLDADEEARILAGAALLHRLTNSPHNRLEDKFKAFFSVLEEAKEALSKRDAKPPDLREAFAETLTAFRVYLNHMPPWFREEHGKDSEVERVWKRACSEEYDRSFDYRVAYNLRNESDHRSDVVDVRLSARVTGPQSSERRVSITLRDDVLDRAIADGRWQARIRQELRTHPRPVIADDLLRSLYRSVDRILARTLLAQQQSIEDSIQTVRSAAASFECDGNPVLMRFSVGEEGWPRTTQSLKMQSLPIGAADILERALEDSASILWPTFAIRMACVGPVVNLHTVAPDLARCATVSLLQIATVSEREADVLLQAVSAEAAQQAVAQAVVATWPPGIGVIVGTPVPVDD